MLAKDSGRGAGSTGAAGAAAPPALVARGQHGGRECPCCRGAKRGQKDALVMTILLYFYAIDLRAVVDSNGHIKQSVYNFYIVFCLF